MRKDVPKLVLGYLDDQVFGSFRRVLLLVRHGRRLVTAIEPSTLLTAHVPMKDVWHLTQPDKSGNRTCSPSPRHDRTNHSTPNQSFG